MVKKYSININVHHFNYHRMCQLFLTTTTSANTLMWNNFWGVLTM